MKRLPERSIGVETVANNQRQFGIRHLLGATLVAAFVISFAPQIRDALPGHRDLTVFCTTVSVGICTRWLGWNLHWPPGSIGRHAIAFFAAVMGCAVMIVIMSYHDSWSIVMRDIPDGLGAAASIFGILLGATIECTFWLLSLALSATIGQPSSTEPNNSGEP